MSPRRKAVKYPAEVRAGGGSTSAVYVRTSDHYAVLDRRPDEPVDDAVLTLEGGSIAVFRGEPQEKRGVRAAADRSRTRAEPAPTVAPVYRLGANGPLAVPTGLVFARFSDGVSVESRREDLRRAGYDVVEIPSYAPHAAWLRARSGEIADALAETGALEALPDMEGVEPQMLMQAARR
jgi:hypothetical protein